MTRHSWMRAFGVLLLASASAACATYSDVRFAPAVQDTELRGEANDLQARIAVAWRGVGELDGVHELRFRVRIDNPGATPFTLVPAEFELLDGALTSFGPARAESLPVVVESGGSATFDLAFPVPAPASLDDFDLGALTLESRFQAGRWSWRATFAREPEAPSPWSFGFGVSTYVH